MDVRVLAATHVDLERAIEQGRFREDLYYRLNVLQVVTAPLRDRHGDLSMLASHFAHFYSLETGRRPRSFSEHALAAMGRHDWPGNVRELANRVRRGLVLAEGRQIEAQDLGLQPWTRYSNRWARWKSTSTEPSARRCAMYSAGTVTT